MLRSDQKLRRFCLSDPQRELWATQQAVPGVPINAAQYVEVSGPVDVDEFVRHTSRSVREGEFLQLRFEDTDEGLVGVYDPALHYWPEVIDLRDEPDPDAVAQAMMREDYARPLDPRVDRTARGCLFLLAEDRFLVYNRAHHLLTDGMGGKDRMVEALAAYTAGVRGEPPPPPNPVDLDMPARADAEYRASRRFEIDRAHWRDTMAGVGIAKTLAHREGVPEAIGRQVSAAIPDAAMASLRTAAERNSTILPTVIAGAFGAYLSRVADGDEVIYQFPVAARTTKELRSTPLPVANTVPLRTHVTVDSSVAAALKTTQSALMGALRHQRYRGEDIWADVTADETSGRTPRTSSQERSGPMLNLMLFDREFPCGDATATFHVLTVGLADDLTINIYPVPGESGSGSLMVGFEANPNRYDKAGVEVHDRRFLAGLETISQALHEGVAARHETLRTVYPDQAREPVALVSSAGEAVAKVPITSLTFDGAGIERAVAHPFGLTVDVPWRAVFDSSRAAGRPVLVVHHIANAQWLLPMVLADDSVAVHARKAGHEPTWQGEAAGTGGASDVGAETSVSAIYGVSQIRRAPYCLAMTARIQLVGLAGGPDKDPRRFISSGGSRRAVEVARGSERELNSQLGLAVAAAHGAYSDHADGSLAAWSELNMDTHVHRCSRIGIARGWSRSGRPAIGDRTTRGYLRSHKLRPEGHRLARTNRNDFR